MFAPPMSSRAQFMPQQPMQQQFMPQQMPQQQFGGFGQQFGGFGQMQRPQQFGGFGGGMGGQFGGFGGGMMQQPMRQPFYGGGMGGMSGGFGGMQQMRQPLQLQAQTQGPTSRALQQRAVEQADTQPQPEVQPPQMSTQGPESLSLMGRFQPSGNNFRMQQMQAAMGRGYGMPRPTQMGIGSMRPPFAVNPFQRMMPRGGFSGFFR